MMNTSCHSFHRHVCYYNVEIKSAFSELFLQNDNLASSCYYLFCIFKLKIEQWCCGIYIHVIELWWPRWMICQMLNWFKVIQFAVFHVLATFQIETLIKNMSIQTCEDSCCLKYYYVFPFDLKLFGQKKIQCTNFTINYSFYMHSKDKNSTFSSGRCFL